MQRLLLEELMTWKQKNERKPLLIDGARQTGKTYLLQHLFGQHFPAVMRIDFLERHHLAGKVPSGTQELPGGRHRQKPAGRLPGTQGASALEQEHIVMPLYFAQHVVSTHLT